MAATGLASHARHVIGENPLTAAAFALFAMFIVLAVAGPWLAPYDPLATDAAAAMQPPSARHWFGTDSLGRDVLSRVMVAARVDFGIALSAVALSSVLGIGLGMLAGYYGGWFDRGVWRESDGGGPRRCRCVCPRRWPIRVGQLRTSRCVCRRRPALQPTRRLRDHLQPARTLHARLRHLPQRNSRRGVSRPRHRLVMRPPVSAAGKCPSPSRPGTSAPPAQR